jgi:hypothetical protein
MAQGSLVVKSNLLTRITISITDLRQPQAPGVALPIPAVPAVPSTRPRGRRGW